MASFVNEPWMRSLRKYSTNIKLCESCYDALTATIATSTRVSQRHHATYVEFLDAVSYGCEFCKALKAELTEHHFQTLEQQAIGPSSQSLLTVVNGRPSDGHSEGAFRLEFSFSSNVNCQISKMLRASLRPPQKIKLQLHVRPSTIIDQDMFTTPQGSSTSSENAWQTAMRWLNTCVSSHSACETIPQKQPSMFPTRLLDVSALDKDVVALVDTTEVQVQGAYCTLSHTWGRQPFLTLTTNNMANMKAGIALQSLKQLFQDALRVTKKMNVRWLFLDSMCIVQDDPFDWERELKAMHRYYANAFCNIAATAAIDGTEGLFRPRDGAVLKHMNFSMPSRTHDSPEVTYNIVNVSHWLRSVHSAPLHERSWVLQERLLSKRTLGFAQGQLTWECAEQTCTEMFSNGLPEVEPLRQLSRIRRITDIDFEHDALPLGATLSFEQRWAQVVQLYSGSVLTYSNDRAAALHGLVQLFESNLHNQCIYGLWTGDFVRQMLWRRETLFPSEDAMIYDEPRNYNVPSWSWLSANVVVNVDCTHYAQCTFVADLLQRPEKTILNAQEYLESREGQAVHLSCYTLKTGLGIWRSRRLPLPHLSHLETVFDSAWSVVYWSGTFDIVATVKDRPVEVVFVAILPREGPDSGRERVTVAGLILDQHGDEDNARERIGSFELRFACKAFSSASETFAHMMEQLGETVQKRVVKIL